MHLGDGNHGVRGLGEGVLEEARICPSKYAFVVRVKADMNNLLAVKSCNGDGGRKLDFNRFVNYGKHCVCLGVCQRDDKVSQL